MCNCRGSQPLAAPEPRVPNVEFVVLDGGGDVLLTSDLISEAKSFADANGGRLRSRAKVPVSA